jgi:hypothetical protein
MSQRHGMGGLAIALLFAVATVPAQSPPGKPNFSGVWVLNRHLSDVPSQPAVSGNSFGPSDQGGRPGGIGPGTIDGVTGRGRPGGPPSDGYRGDRYGQQTNRPEGRAASEDLTSDLRNPSASLTISHADPTLTITDARERTRLFQTNGQQDPHQVGAATVVSTTRWESDRLVTEYDLGSGRKIRIVYSLTPGTRQLLDQITFPSGQTIKHVYDPVKPIRRN